MRCDINSEHKLSDHYLAQLSSYGFELAVSKLYISSFNIYDFVNLRFCIFEVLDSCTGVGEGGRRVQRLFES